jgi:hypothetical protein
MLAALRLPLLSRNRESGDGAAERDEHDNDHLNNDDTVLITNYTYAVVTNACTELAI